MSIGGGAERARLVALVPFILVRQALAGRWAALTESSAASAALVDVRVLVRRLRRCVERLGLPASTSSPLAHMVWSETGLLATM